MSSLVIFQPEGESPVSVRLEGDTVWLTQEQMSMLFGVQVPGISKHLKKIYESGELDRAATLSKMETAQEEGRRRATAGTTRCPKVAWASEQRCQRSLGLAHFCERRVTTELPG